MVSTGYPETHPVNEQKINEKENVQICFEFKVQLNQLNRSKLYGETQI